MTETNSLYVCSNSIYVCFVNVIDAGVSKVDIWTPNSHSKAMATRQREKWRKEGGSNGDRVDAE